MTARPAPHPRNTPCEDDPELFDDPTRRYEARRACRGCWNLNPCAAQALNDERNHRRIPAVVGGMFPHERTNLVEQRTDSRRGLGNTPAPCGTKAARNRHQRKQEECDVCQPNTHTRVLQPCGTPAAAARHRKAGEPVCGPCQTADNIARKTSKIAALQRARKENGAA